MFQNSGKILKVLAGFVFFIGIVFAIIEMVRGGFYPFFDSYILTGVVIIFSSWISSLALYAIGDAQDRARENEIENGSLKSQIGTLRDTIKSLELTIKSQNGNRSEQRTAPTEFSKNAIPQQSKNAAPEPPHDATMPIMGTCFLCKKTKQITFYQTGVEEGVYLCDDCIKKGQRLF